MWITVVGLSLVVGISWSMVGLVWHRRLNDQTPTPLWKYFLGNVSLFGFTMMILELNGKTFRIWHGIVLGALFSGSFLSRAVLFEHWDDDSTGALSQKSLPSQ